MTSKASEVLGISNAVVDVLCQVEHELISKLDIAPGSMNLIDREGAERIYGLMGPATERAGGSVANSIACLASLGGRSAYIGRVADDQLGQIFNHDMASLGVDVRLPAETRSAPTARSYVLVTPDGERTMNTYLGACTELAPSDITATTVGNPAIVLLEGYVWDTPQGPESMQKAIELAKPAGARIALSLSDSFCVERHLDAFRALADSHADIILGNEAETRALYGTESLAETRERARSSGKLVAMTRSEHGSEILTPEAHITVGAEAVDQVVDSTGAGDAWVAGFLYGLAQHQSAEAAAQLGTQCASLAIRQVGARPEPALLKALTSSTD